MKNGEDDCSPSPRHGTVGLNPAPYRGGDYIIAGAEKKRSEPRVTRSPLLDNRHLAHERPPALEIDDVDAASYQIALLIATVPDSGLSDTSS